MTASTEKQCKCRLCGDYFSDSEMSEEHYPARNTGNEDIVAVDLGKMLIHSSQKMYMLRLDKSWTMVKHLKASLETYLIHS